MKKFMVIMVVLMAACSFAGAEEAAVAASGSWAPVIGEAVSVAIGIVGSALTVLVTALVWKLLGKFGIEKNVAINALMTTYIKQGINYADSWADTQKDKPAGDKKMVAAIKHILGLVGNSKLPKIAEEKLKDMVEAQLARDKKVLPEAPDDKKVING